MHVMDHSNAPGLEEIQGREQSYSELVWARFRRHRLAMTGLIILSLLILVAVFAPWIAPYPQEYIDYQSQQFAEPTSQHLLGTDNVGRDVLSRLIFASRVSLTVGFLSTLLGGLIGITIGILAGFYGGWVDSVLMRFTDVMLSLPLLPLLLIMSAFLRQSRFWNGNITLLQIGVVVLVLVFFGWFTDARLIRGVVLSLRSQDFITASRATGASDPRLIFAHLLPNAITPIIVNATLNVGGYIVLESSLSFLGLGINPPVASWGNMLADFQTYILMSPLLAIYPGFCIFLTVLSINFLGDGLRDALDPRQLL